ncbi:MAG TPA: IS4 family transposase [Candidatus Babeliaceae bacterium]|nr:IS4 family transposase [Candidatus Babeliaceae bacterium]
MTDCASRLQHSITASFDTTKLAELARTSGFLRRESKLKPEEFIEMLMFSDSDHSQLSLQDCCNDLAQQKQKLLSKEALHKRFNSKSVEFLKLVLAHQLALKFDIDPGTNWQSFSKVVVHDSSKFSLPKRYKDDYPGYGNFASAIMNIQYSFDLKHGNWEALDLTKVTENDPGYSKRTIDRIRYNELHIRDLGFITMNYLCGIIKEKAFFLNRLPPQWVPVQCSTGKRINWANLYKKMQDSNRMPFETIVTIGKGESAFDCRLIAVAVPDEVWAERVRKAEAKAKSQRLVLSDEYKLRCRFSVFITNTDEQLLRANDIIQLYRLRWQIELIFKTWKSVFSIHKIKPVKRERLICQLFAKFIWILMNWKIFSCIDAFIRRNSTNYACSIWKFAKQARSYTQVMRKVITGVVSCRDWLKIFLCPIIKSLLIEDKKGKKSAYAIVYDIFKPLG